MCGKFDMFRYFQREKGIQKRNIYVGKLIALHGLIGCIPRLIVSVYLVDVQSSNQAPLYVQPEIATAAPEAILSISQFYVS